ncbi:MAG: hypothetical protein PHP22_11200 [Oscillospiraceae bacterium]|nr:hypothetical protein [Oscillospiraceae bacterium]
MKSKLNPFWTYSLAGTLIVSFYPLYMGFRVIFDMIRQGQVFSEDYPKYIIPYTPISLSVIVGVLLMPVIFRLAKRWALPVASALSVAVFFVSELLFENLVIVMSTEKAKLEDWQMFMCVIMPDKYETRTWRAVDILIGDYDPMFKLHFYLISVLIILALLNCFYGFGNMVRTGDRRKLKALVLQAVSTILFLSLSILACFTAFFRDGELRVGPVSAVLMCVYFVIFGLTAGIYVGSFLLAKNRVFSLLLPAFVASTVTLLMYIGEMILLSGHLYRFGEGFFFDALGGLVLAPIDLLIILVSGIGCAGILTAISGREETA